MGTTCGNWSAALVAGLLFIAACGGDDAVSAVSPTSAAPETSSPATTATTTTTAPEATGDPPLELDGTSWVVTNITLASGSLTNVWDDTEVTISFEGGTVSGSTGCNEYSGEYETNGRYDPFEPGIRDSADGQVMRIGALTVTERGCEERIMEQEADILRLLGDTGRWVIVRGGLHLRDGEGRLLLETDPA